MIVCVGIPSFDGKPLAATVDSLLAEQFVCSRQGVNLLVQWENGIPYVAVARNRLVKQFLDVKNAECMVFVDADMSWPAGTLLKLIQHKHDVIGGTYRPKEPSGRFHVDVDKNRPEKVGDLWKVDGLPGGFLKLSRNACETLETRQYKDYSGQVWRDYFPVGYLDGSRYYQEDYGFCWQWRAQGGDVWLDPSLHLRHHDGLRLTYEGNAAKWMDDTYGTSDRVGSGPQKTHDDGRTPG